ncbi:hypothetical protein GGI05_001866 [Coemansia sp. RSA 2603]|nr:hypothetical protein GGI05_001866 [Coemansia sp. RSA 2603]
MAASTQKHADDGASDVEATKRTLQALVEAGIHAQGLLAESGSEGSGDEDSEDEDEDEDADEDSGDESSQAQDEDAGGDQGEPSHADGMAAGGDGAHEALLSRMASSFRVLIDHGLTAAASHGGAQDEAGALGDESAYALACETLASNLRCQRALRAQLAALDAAQRRNGELQAGIGALLTMQARASTRRGARRGGGGGARGDERGGIDPVTGEARIGAMAFVDADGGRPADNRDTVRKKKHPPIVYRARRWTEAEREALVRGVRACNRRIMAQRAYAQTQDPRSVWDVDALADGDLEMNLAGLDWKHISRQFVPQHKPVECAIQWATQDHPIINRAPWSKREERALAAVADEHGGRDWVAIAKALGTQRTAAQCFQVFQRKLNADMSRSKWTAEEDRVLTEAVMAYGEGDWQAVAACLDNRTGQQVLHRWCKSINPAIRSGRWDRDEDVALLAAVRLYGVGQWTKIAKHVPGRTDVKCRERYMNVLTPDVNNTQWTADEDARLVALVARVGVGKWSYVADMLGGRTDNQCWRHWRSLHKRGAAPDPPELDHVPDGDADAPEEGTVASFPEWEAERNEAHLGFASTQGGGRKRKTTSGIESARKRQWKRATSTNFVPLLAAVPASTPATGVVSAGSAITRPEPLSARSEPPLTGESLVSSLGSPAPSSAALPAASPTSLRRGRALNWASLLHTGAERKHAGDASPDAHLRPVLPTLLTSAALQRLVSAVPAVADAFNAALVGIADDAHPPAMADAPMAWLRQRIEAVFIWPLMLGTLDMEEV